MIFPFDQLPIEQQISLIRAALFRKMGMDAWIANNKNPSYNRPKLNPSALFKFEQENMKLVKSLMILGIDINPDGTVKLPEGKEYRCPQAAIEDIIKNLIKTQAAKQKQKTKP